MDNHAGETSFDGFPVETVLAVAPGRGNQRRALAIVGSHPLGLNLVPWNDPDVDILVFNEAPMKPEKYPRWDMCLQIHGEDVYASPRNWVNPDYWPWLQEPHGKTVYMQKVDPRVPDSVEYPLDEILRLVPYKYLRSSPAMALALGIHLGYPEIQLFGSELSSNTEYAYQAINYAFWIGFAHGRGIDLKLMCWRDEFDQKIYGYEGELQLDKAHFWTRAEMHKDAYSSNSNSLRKLVDKINDAMLKNEYEKVGQLTLSIESASMITGETQGAMDEAIRYHERDNLISRQEFERVSAQAQIDGDKAKSDMHHASGKVEYVWNVWKATGNLQALQQLRAFLKEKQALAYETGRQLGVFRENIEYMAEYDARLTAAGGVRALGRPA